MPSFAEPRVVQVNTRDVGYARLLVLDGIRGWGSVVVLFYHLFCVCLPIPGANATALLKFPLFDGPLAVWVFFVTSGFSLSVGFCQQPAKARVQRLAVGRYIRLMVPIAATAGLTYAAFRLGLIPDIAKRPGALGLYLRRAPSFVETVRFSVRNVFFDYDASASLIPPLGTIHTELYGSFLLLGSILVIGSSSRRFIYYTLVALASSWIDLRYTAFIVGLVSAEGYVAMRSHMNSIRYLRLWSTVLYLPMFAWSYWYRTNNDLSYFAFSAMLVPLLVFNLPAARFLSSRLSCFLGSISFSLYLIHMLMLYLLAAPMYRYFGSGIKAAWIVDLCSVAGCLAAAAVWAKVDHLGVSWSRRFAGFFIPRAGPNAHKAITP